LAHKATNSEEVTSNKNNYSQSNSKTAKLTISLDKKSVSYEGQSGRTALDVLKSLTSVTTQQSDYGQFVTGISGVNAENGKQFWAFYVNGVLASEGAGTYISKNSEKIEWKMEAIKL
jgi:hypothetical protein